MTLGLQGLDYIAVLIYILLMAVVGVLFGWLVKDSGSYFKGNGTIPWVMATITNFMGLFSTFVFVAYAGIAYEYGIVSITVFWCTVPACILGGLFLAGRWRRTGKTTPMEYLETRYNISVRQTMSWVGLVMRFLDNMVRLYAIGVFITAVTPLSLEMSILISGLIVTLFNLFGGIWSVTIMSTIQFIILILITLVLLPLSLSEVGGFAGLSQSMPDHLDWFNGPKGAPFWLSIYCIMTIIKYNENWTFIQKFYCVKDERAAKKTGIFTGILFLVFTPVFLLPAVAGPLIVPGMADPEMSYVALSVKLLPAGIMGILFSSMFAATMSSLNAEYNVMSGVVTHDIYQRLFKPDATDRQMLSVARWSTLLIGLVMIGGAILIQGMGGAFEANKLFTGIMAIPLGIPLLLGIVSKRPGGMAAILTILSGVVIGVVLNLIPAISWEGGTLLEIILCLIIYYLPYKNTRSTEKELQVEEFFIQLETPIREEDKPTIHPAYKRVVIALFIFSLIVAGVLFCGMSIPSLETTGGLYSFIAGTICLVCAALLWIMTRKNKQTKE
ncbi:MAG: sodium transporter [Bacteroidales bacterium]|nr:sodium transporter [Bacteroidales bacterium]